jgi:hypothetical protein
VFDLCSIVEIVEIIEIIEIIEIVCGCSRSRWGSRTGSEGCRLGSDTDEPLRRRLARDHLGHR